MSDMRTELEFDSSLLRTWWELNTQFHATVSSPRDTVVFAIGVATAYLSFVAGTVAILSALRFWWASAILVGLGIATLVFVWSVAIAGFDETTESW